MLAQWFKKEEQPQEVKQEKKKARMVVDPEATTPAISSEEATAKKEAALEKKLRDSLKEGPPHPQSMVTYDGTFRSAQRVLMDGNMAEQTDGLSVTMSRNVQNTMVTSKWMFGNPQMSHWEISLQMNGFSDVTSVSYNTSNRWQLMYQRMFRSGATGVMQLLSQPQGDQNAGTFFGLIQYPWVHGGCTALQYVKQQTVSVSHMQRLIRGVYVGSCLNFDPNTKGTNVSYAASATNPSKTSSLAAEVKPHSGEWKVAYSRADWGTDQEMTAQLEFTEKRNGKISLLSVGLRKQLIGGGVVNCVVSGFSKLRAVVEMPFGGDRAGLNQLMMSYSLQYDIPTGGLKQGVSFVL